MIEKKWLVSSILLIISGIIIGFLSFSSITRAENKTICIYLFYGETCPHCAQEKLFLNNLKNKYPQIEVHYFEVYFNKKNQNFLKNVAKEYNATVTGVPMTFIGNKAFSGFAEGNDIVYNQKNNVYAGYSGVIEKTIEEYVNSGAECPSIKENSINFINKTIFYVIIFLAITCLALVSLLKLKKIKFSFKFKVLILNFLLTFPLTFHLAYAQDKINVPIFGEVSTKLPIPLLGAILGLIDGGFNPCALSVLFFLIAYLMALGSRRKCLMIGLTYSFMIFVVYFLFMYGVLSVISIIGYLEIIKTIVGVLIIIAGIIEIKDFFWYGKGVSLEIPKFAKFHIEKLTKAATIPSAILLGFFVSLVEIPCAGAFPLIYLTILAGTSGLMNILYLLWYNLFFVLPLILLVIIFYFGLLKVEEAEEKRIKLRKYMRLVAGLIMLSLGSAMLLRVI